MELGLKSEEEQKIFMLGKLQMKDFIKLIIIAQIFFFSFNQMPFSLQNRSSTSPDSFLKEKYSEYFNQGENFKLQGNYEKSIEFFRKALSLAQKNNDKKERTESLIKLGVLYWNIGELDSSLKIYKEALALADKTKLIKKKEGILNYIQIYDLYQIGKDYRFQGKHQKSIENFEKAIALARKIKSEEHEVKCLRQLSVTHSELNDIDKLFSLNKLALEIAQRLNHKKEEGRCLYNIGLYYGAIDDYSQALQHYEEALRIARILKDYNDESYCLTNISDIYINVGNYDKALEYLKEVLRIDQQLEEETYVAIDLNNIGVTYQKKALHSDNIDDLYNALEYFEDSLKIARKTQNGEIEIQALNNIGMVYKDLRNYPEALKYFKFGLEKAENFRNVEEIANILINIGSLYSKQENYELSIKYFQKAIDTASGIKGEKILWEAYFEIANAYMKQNNYHKSLECYKKAISYLENIRSRIQLEELKASYLGTDRRIETFQNIINLLYKLYESEPEKLHNIQAFNYLERAKARAFLDRLEESQVNISRGVDTELLYQEDELMKEISNLNSELFTPGISAEQKININDQIKVHEERLEVLKREIRLTSPAYADLKYPQTISLEQTQEQMLDDNTAFFEYSIGKKNSYAFVVTKRKFKIYPIPSAKQIQMQVKEYLQAITDKGNQDFHLGYELFRILVSPGLDEKIEKIIFIPDDILHYLPFEALLSQKNGRSWLIKDYKISYVPSISALREIIQHERLNDQKPKKDLLAFGDPFFGPDEEGVNREETLKDFNPDNTVNFPRLKYSGLEIEKIASLFKKTKINIYKRKAATEEQLKKLDLTDYKILHFATHGLIDDKIPARSSIIFTLGNNSSEDGFLQMREIFNLKLNSDLVTLSACQTGLGQFIKGEGIEGLSRAFFYAGASSVLISLWPVHDQASSQFMQRYYLHLRSSNSIMNALQKTKLELIDSDVLSHPYYWAGFVVTGKSDKIIYSLAKKKWFIIILLLCLAGGIISFIILKKRNQK